MGCHSPIVERNFWNNILIFIGWTLWFMVIVALISAVGFIGFAILCGISYVHTMWTGTLYNHVNSIDYDCK